MKANPLGPPVKAKPLPATYVAVDERDERDDGFDEGRVTDHVSARVPTHPCILRPNDLFYGQREEADDPGGIVDFSLVSSCGVGQMSARSTRRMQRRSRPSTFTVWAHFAVCLGSTLPTFTSARPTVVSPFRNDT